MPRFFLTQSQFDTWASSTKARNVYALGLALLFVAAACTFAIAVMGPRLVREGALLWFGTYAEGTVREIGLKEDGTFKGGATIRTDVRTPPDLPPGAPIGVYYSPTNPANSVAEHNLRTDVYALVLFLPFLGVMGIGLPMLWAYRFWRWSRAS